MAVNLGCRHCRKPSSACDCPASVQRATPIVATRDAGATIANHSAEVRMRILRAVCDNERWARLVQLGRERATSIGAQEYGDASYFKPLDTLEWEGECEIADLIFYWSVIEELIAS